MPPKAYRQPEQARDWPGGLLEAGQPSGLKQPVGASGSLSSLRLSEAA